MIHKLTRTIVRTFAFALALCATTSAWAAAGDTVTFNNDKTPKWTGTATPDLAAADTYTITIPIGTLSSGDYVRMSSFAFAQNSTSQALQVMYVSCVDYNGETVTSGIANGNGLHAGASGGTATKFANIAGWKQVYTFGDVGADNELILKVGTSYTFALLGSDKNKTAQEKVVTFPTTEASTSPVVHSATASNQRIEQEVVVKVLAATTQSTSTGGNWSELTWSNAPADWSSASAAPVLVIVEESCSIALDTSVSVDSMIFDITPGKTLTLTGANTITAANGMFIKGGTIAVANEGTLSGAIKVQGDAGITISGNSDTAGSVSIDVAEGKTLNLSASALTSADTINLTGSGAVVPQTTIAAKVDIGAGVTVSANSGATIRVSNFKGAGTIVFDGVLPSNAAAASSTVTASATDSSNWTGTLWLKNYNTTQASTGLYVSYWCNTNSKLKFTNVSGFLPTNGYLGYNGSELGEWILEDEVVDAVTKYAFTKTDGYSGYWVRFKKLSGSGTMAEKSGATQTPQVRIADGSEFKGTLKLDQGMRVAFSDSDPSTISAKQIVIASGEEVTANSAWTTDGFVVNGTLNLNATPSGKVVSGSGTVNLGALSVANGISGFASAAAWTGKVVVPSVSTGSNLSIGFNSLGNSGSTVILKGLAFSGNYPAVYPAEAGTGSTVNPTLQIDGDVTFTWGHSSEYVTSFSRITGSGNLNFDACNGDCTYKYKINTLEGYTGLLGVFNNGTYKMQLEIGTLALDSMPTTSDRIVKIKTDSNWGNIVNVANIAVTVGGNATEYKLVKKNVGTATAGLYLAPAVIKSSTGTLTPYASVSDALTAVSALSDDDYEYVAVFETTSVTFADDTNPSIKIKAVGEGVTVTLNSGYGDKGWVEGEPDEDGIVTYTYSYSLPATYTWVGEDDANWFDFTMTSWSCGGVAPTRMVGASDNTIFASDAQVTINVNGCTAASITNSAAVTFTASEARALTIGDGGVVLSAAGASITLNNVTLSKVPTTTAVTLAVQTTGGGEDPTVYTVVNSVASVDGVGYATIAEASEALKTGSIMTLQQDYDGTVTIYPGKYLVQNGYTVTSVIGAATDDTTDDGIVVTRSGNSVANYYWSCVDQRTATWSGAGSAYWTVMGNWVEQFTPTTYTAVTIPATEGHATAITLSGDVSIKSLTLCAGETLTLSRSGDTARTLTTSQAIVLTSGQSIITNPGVTISPAITTEDANSYVKSVTSEGATTYTVAAHKATVYDSEDAEVKKFDSVVDAFAAATDGQKITLFANSSDAITLSDKSITFNEGSYTFSGTFTGNGTVVLTSTLKSAATARWAEGWTGTVVLPANLTLNGLNFDNYGRTGSTVQLQGTNTGWLQYRSNDDPIATTVEIPQGASLTVTGWSVSFAHAFDVLKGAGTFAVSLGSAPDASGSSSYTAYFLLKDVSAFTGSLSATGAGIAIGDTRIANTVAGGKIIVSAGKTPTIASGATWQAAGGFTVDGSLTCSKGGKIYGTGAAGTLALGGSGVITNRYEGGSSQCFNAGTITVSDSLSVVMVGGWSNFGTTWKPQNSSSIGFDPGTDNDIWLNSTIPNNSNANCTLCIYGNGSNKVVWNSNSITPWAKIHVYNGGKLQIGTATGTSDYLGYASIGSLGAVTVDAGGELYFYTRESYTRHTYLNGGTITFAGDAGSRSFDIFRGPTVYVTDDSVMQATGSGHWVYLRDTAPTFNVDANKTLTFNASFTYAGESNKDLIKVGAGTMVVNGYVDGSGNHESFSQPRGVTINAGTYELNAVQTSNGQTGANANFYTVASGAKLKIGATGKANMTTLNLVDGSLLEFGASNATLINANTVAFTSGEVAVSLSEGVTPANGTKLIDWTTEPAGGTFTLEGCPQYRVVAKSDGLYLMKKPGTIFSVY